MNSTKPNSAANTDSHRRAFDQTGAAVGATAQALPASRSRAFVSTLTAIKIAHTVVWAFFVACILAIPFFTARSEFGFAALFTAIVAGEVGILLLNRMRCPLTGVAARYTHDRRANFDIYLPEWLARNNKRIFGTLYAFAVLFLAVRLSGAA